MSQLIASPKLSPVRNQTFADEADRARLARIGLEAFRRAADAWGLTGAESAALLGVSPSTWDRLKKAQDRETLSQDQLTRISAIVGVYKGLHLLFADAMADRWPRLPNAGPLFGGATPVASMIDGGIPRMLDVRRLIDAVRGGL
ncbi:MAG: antitoxin Xre-like helix-turn-helix domain-containing protein [Parvularculaceae bacterium]|nr:antitoxin Xre-like helix-turn-helix domain-containing protein [Parvularculaceae bacterium]